MAQSFSVDVLSHATGGFSSRIYHSNRSDVYRGWLSVGQDDTARDVDCAIKELRSGSTPGADQLLTELTALRRVSHNNLLEI